MPAGLIAAFRPLTHASLFLVLYGVTAIYFSGVMVRSPARHLFCCFTFLLIERDFRLLYVLAPLMCWLCVTCFLGRPDNQFLQHCLPFACTLPAQS